eukprot:scaffold258284_cov30-Tisochrysis_lutea.AAC.1
MRRSFRLRNGSMWIRTNRVKSCLYSHFVQGCAARSCFHHSECLRHFRDEKYGVARKQQALDLSVNSTPRVRCAWRQGQALDLARNVIAIWGKECRQDETGHPRAIRAISKLVSPSRQGVKRRAELHYY